MNDRWRAADREQPHRQTTKVSKPIESAPERYQPKADTPIATIPRAKFPTASNPVALSPTAIQPLHAESDQFHLTEHWIGDLKVIERPAQQSESRSKSPPLNFRLVRFPRCAELIFQPARIRVILGTYRFSDLLDLQVHANALARFQTKRSLS